MQPTPQPFRKCHLQILRSLYDGNKALNRHGDGDHNLLLLGGAVTVDESNSNTNRSNDTDVSTPNKTSSEVPVDSEIWSLIERFLLRRMDYRPHKERQIHWANVHAEAQSRLDHVSSVASSAGAIVEEDKKLPMQRSSSLTPRTPLFTISGRGGSSLTPNLSLTPTSSNRNPTHHTKSLSQNDRELASTIPSWNFIGQMLQRRSRLCIQSCTSFRSQPFLAQLRDEAEMRCKVLEGVLQKLKTGITLGEDDNSNNDGNTKREGSMIANPVGKRRKSEVGVGSIHQSSDVPSSLGHFFSNKNIHTTNNGIDDETNQFDEESIMEAQMKLCLWSSLLSSVKEIVDEN